MRYRLKLVMRRGLPAALLLAAMLLLDRGAAAVTHANACWNPAFNDPSSVDISDVSGLVLEDGLHSDPMDDVRRALLVMLRPTGRVAPSAAATVDDASSSPHLPRAPPAV
jgi:hypothetical protein